MSVILIENKKINENFNNCIAHCSLPDIIIRLMQN